LQSYFGGVTGASDLGGELMSVAAGLRRVTRRRLSASLGLRPLPEAQRELLIVVRQRPGIGVAGAAAELGLAGNSVSTLVNALVEADLLRREQDPDDRRAARLTLTEAAQRRLATWRAARDELLGAALARAGAEDRRAIEAALPALRRLLEELRGDLRGEKSP
jgi:DNA-binding MarR family transcriptional regulator